MLPVPEVRRGWGRVAPPRSLALPIDTSRVTAVARGVAVAPLARTAAQAANPVLSSHAHYIWSVCMQIEERMVGDVVVLDLKGKVTLGEGDELLKDKVNSMVNQGHKKII